MPSYISKLVFPEQFLTALRTITMKEKELYQVSSLLEEVRGLTNFFLILLAALIFLFLVLTFCIYHKSAWYCDADVLYI